jgi:drug/metabolite transporter (DMT)-like permease
VALWTAVEALAAGVLRTYSPYQVVFTRYAVHLALAAALWGGRDPIGLVRTGRPAAHVGRSLLMLVMPASWILAGERGVPVDTTLAVFWTSPLLVLALARLVLRERSPRAAWVLAALASAGAMALHRPRSLPPLELLAYPAAMALSFSLYLVATRALRTEPLRANLFHTALWVALPLSFAMPRLWSRPSLPDLAAMVGVGLLGFGALWALDRMAAAAPLGTAAPIVGLQAPMALGLATLAGAELPGPKRALAAALVVAAAAAAWAWRREPAPEVT